MPALQKIIIVTPYMADANNGNWRTAQRWQTLLAPYFSVIVQGDWNDEPCDVLIALHARRSAAPIARYRAAHPDAPLVVVLTGTDLYRDLATSAEAQTSLNLATRLIVLQDDAIQHVPVTHRKKTHIVYQSAKPLTPATKFRGKLDAVVVGHLREEKDPATIFAAMETLSGDTNITLQHIGAPLDAQLAARAEALARENPRYTWSGALAHGLTRAAIKRAHVLVHPSIMEGGANVIVEAITAGTPVLASYMSGNVGMQGKDYEGYFPVGNASALAALMLRCVKEPNFYSRLNLACRARARLFLPVTEQTTLKLLLEELLPPA